MAWRRALACLAGFAIAGGCASPPAGNEAARATVQARNVAETPLPAAPPAREARYYVDEQGMVWDDRGRKLGPKADYLPTLPRP